MYCMKRYDPGRVRKFALTKFEPPICDNWYMFPLKKKSVANKHDFIRNVCLILEEGEGGHFRVVESEGLASV